MVQLHYTDTGNGDNALVFLHYFGGSGGTWEPVITVLEKQYRCIAIDLPGFGKSPAPDTLPTVHHNRDGILQVLEQLQLKRFRLVGHSMGGKIALAVAAMQPEGLSGILLFAPSPPSPEPMSNEDRQNLQDAFGNEEKIRKHLLSIIAAPLDPLLFENTVADNLMACKNAWDGWLQVGSNEDISGEMQSIQVPLTVVSGSEDKSLSTAFLRKEFSQYFTNVSFIELKGSGHLIPLEKPDAVVEIVRKEG